MATIKNITFRNDMRTVIVKYLTIKENRKAMEKAEKSALEALKDTFAELGKEYHGNGKATKYLFGTVQEQNKARYVVYKETTVSGRIDWEAYARSLPGFNEADAETFRKESYLRPGIDWATDKQVEEIQK